MPISRPSLTPAQLAATRALVSDAGIRRPGRSLDVWPDPDVPIQQGCTARPVFATFIDFDNGNDANAGTLASPKKTADVASWTGSKTSWFSNEVLLFRAGSLTRTVTETVTDPVTGEVVETRSVRCGMEHLASTSGASIGLTSRKHLGAYWATGDDRTVRPVFRSLNNNGTAGSASRCVVGTSGTVTQIMVSDLIIDIRDVANRNGLSFGEFGDGQTVTNISVLGCTAIGGVTNDANSYSGFKVQLFGQYARTTAYLETKGILFADCLAMGLSGHGFAMNGTHGALLANGRWHGTDLVNCEAIGCGAQYDTHGFTAYSGGVLLNWTTASWALVSGSVYSRNMSTQYGRNVPDIDVLYYDTGSGTERFQLVKNTATPTTPAEGEYGFDSGTQLLYVHVNAAVTSSYRFSSIVRSVKGVRRINCRAVGTKVPVPSITGALEGHGFAFDDGTSDCTDIWCESIANRGHGWTINLGNRNTIIGPIIRRNLFAVVKGNFGWNHVITRGSMSALGFSDTVPGIKAALHLAHASRRALSSGAALAEELGSTVSNCEIEYAGSDTAVALVVANTAGNSPMVDVLGCKLNPGVGSLTAGGRVMIAGLRAEVSAVPPLSRGYGS